MRTRSQSNNVFSRPSAKKKIKRTKIKEPEEEKELGLGAYDENLSEGEEELVRALDKFTDQGRRRVDVQTLTDDNDEEIDDDDDDDDDAPPESFSLKEGKDQFSNMEQMRRDELRQSRITMKERRKEKQQQIIEQRQSQKKDRFLPPDILSKLTDTSDTLATTLSESTHILLSTTAKHNHSTASHLPNHFSVVDLSNKHSLVPKTSMEKAKKFKEKMMRQVKRQPIQVTLNQQKKLLKCGLRGGRAYI